MALDAASGAHAKRLVGRAPQLAAFSAALDVVEEGSSGLLSVPGEAGIGKSRLLEELRGLAESRGLLVLGARADEFEADLPFAVLIDALDDYLAALEIEDPGDLGGRAVVQDASAVLPSLRPLADEVAQAALHTERHRSHAAMRKVLERLIAKQPLILVLDDLHWADEGSLELLSALVRRPPAGPLLVVLAYRPRQLSERFAAALDRAERDGELRCLGLEPLTPEEAAELLAGRLPWQVAAALHQESGGNPFYLEQLARSATPDGARASRAAGPDVAGVPEAVAAVFAEELRALEADARLVLDAAAVAGDPFEPELVAAAADLPEGSVLAALDTLVASDLIRPDEVPRRFAFRHPLLRRAVYEATPAGWRLAAHAATAAALAESGAPPARRAHHMEQSARPGDLEAVGVLRDAGDESAARAPAAAVRWFEAALRLLPPDERALQGELAISRVSALAAVGRLEDARSALLSLLPALPPEAVAARVKLTSVCAAIEHHVGRQEEARARLAAALDELGERRSPEALSLMVDLGTNALYRVRFDEMEAIAEEAAEAARSANLAPHTAAATALLAFARVVNGRVEQAEEARREAAAVLDGLTDDELALRLGAATQLGWAEVYLERFSDAIEHTRRGIQVSRATVQAQYVPMMSQAQGVALAASGRATEGMEVLFGAVEAARLSDNPHMLALALLNYAMGAAFGGDPDAGLAAAHESFETAQRFDVSAFAGSVLGALRVECGQPDGAPETLIAAGGGEELPLVPAAWRPLFLEALTRAELDRGRLNEARSAAETATAVTGELRLADTYGTRARSAVALAEGDPGLAATLALESAAAADGHEGGRIQAARSRALAGRALAAAGERQQAIDELETAVAELEAAGAVRYRDEAVRELRRLGRRPRHRPSPGDRDATGVAALSDREREIAELVTDRRTNKEIAAELFLSEKTVESHLRNVFSKLEVRSRIEVARAVERERHARA